MLSGSDIRSSFGITIEYSGMRFYNDNMPLKSSYILEKLLLE
jgi:hypothetical protein